MVAQSLGVSDKKEEVVAPTPTGKEAQTSNSSGGAKEQQISDNGETQQALISENAKKEAREAERRSFVDRALTMMGLNKEEKEHAKTDIESKGRGNAAAPTANDVAAEARNVSGREVGDISKIDPAALTAATKGLRDSGATMAATDTIAYAGAAQPKQKAEGAMV